VSRFLATIQAMEKMHDTFHGTVLPLINGESGQASSLSMLNQGAEVYRKLLEEFPCPVGRATQNDPKRLQHIVAKLSLLGHVVHVLKTAVQLSIEDRGSKRQEDRNPIHVD